MGRRGAKEAVDTLRRYLDRRLEFSTEFGDWQRSQMGVLTYVPANRFDEPEPITKWSKIMKFRLKYESG